MVGRTGAADTRRVAVEVLGREQVRTVDSIELPPPGEAVVARAERRDSYPILVTRSPEETIERLLQAIGDGRVAVITDETVAELYGPLVIGALEKAGLEPEVATVPSGEAAQDTPPGVRSARLVVRHTAHAPGRRSAFWGRRRD
jgi:hypothetical protein